MAVTQQKTRVVGNTGRVFGSFRQKKKSSSKSTGSHHRRQNLGEIIGFTLANTGRKVGTMATKTKKKKSASHRPKGYGVSKYKSNPGHMKAHGGMHVTKYKRRHNVGGMGGLGPLVTNAVFVIVGALGSKLGAQAVLGSNNVGLLGYAANAAAGGVLWFLTEKVMHNRAAASGVIAGTLVQIILRIINDYTPFGSYVAQLGMGDYQMQSFVTPQVLVDPWNSAEIAIPDGWGAAPPPMLAAPGAGAPAGRGGGNAMAQMTAAAGVPSGGSGGGGGLSGGGLYGGGGGGGLYSL